MLTPRETVEQLDRYIIGQDKAKRAVAIALRNRYRRSRLPKELQDEITPKNIIMIGPTGVGKTEIARRLAKLVDAPFVKVEATKFTEVGYVGRDVDSMIRDLVEAAIRLEKNKRMEQVRIIAEQQAEQRLVQLIAPGRKRSAPPANPLQMLLGAGTGQSQEPSMSEEEASALHSKRGQILSDLRNGLLENEIVELEVEESAGGGQDMFVAMGIDINMNDVLGGILPKKKKKKKMNVAEARRLLIQEESEKLIDMDEVVREAVRRTEQDGIIFLDEIDKIAGKNMGSGPDVSREGVQRDILPVVEGTTVSTKYGPVKTDYILFIAAGAFHVAKISDLIPEQQGRFPIRVELNTLTKEDFKNIMTQPDNAVTKQYAALLGTDNISLQFTDDALEEIANYAFVANEMKENIGARRIFTIMEDLLDDISFNAGGGYDTIEVTIDARYVSERLKSEIKGADLQKYII
jgi:ATP-dependent HslUV protease ATP-binding subunit HslU